MLARALLLLALALPMPALAQLRWIEGHHYLTLRDGKPAEVRPGKIELAEVFSYGCIHCFRSRDDIAALQASLPADVFMTFVHASFQPAEAWPMYQRAWYTAQTMGIGTATHDRMYKAVWETREVALLDAKTGAVRKPLPTIDEAARFHARTGLVKQADFLKLARSPAIDAQMKRADALIASWRIPGTPSLVVNGHYLIDSKTVSSWNDIRALVLYLVDQERRRLARLQPPPTRKP